MLLIGTCLNITGYWYELDEEEQRSFFCSEFWDEYKDYFAYSFLIYAANSLLSYANVFMKAATLQAREIEVYN